MKVKVCGMRDIENIQSLIALEPDFIGFIFYKNSKRYVANFPTIKIPFTIKKVGVFVNQPLQTVLETVQYYQLDFVQLHGNESVEYCEKLSKQSAFNSQFKESFRLGIIKAFSVNNSFNFSITKEYETFCDYFLFDTKGENYGGNGVKFNWEILSNYKGELPFLLSGGITLSDAETIKKLKHSKLDGVDINSGFEIAPGLKNNDLIKQFIKNIE